MDPGTYTILLELETAETIEFGAAGPRDLEAGYYAYTGSAFGPGGLSRVDRHRRIGSGEDATRHWHIDYLLGAEESGFVDTWTGPHRDAECEIADSIGAEAIDGIGATDCSCSSHLHYSPRHDALASTLDALYD